MKNGITYLECRRRDEDITNRGPIKRKANGSVDLDSLINATDARQFKIKALHPGTWRLQAINLLRASDKIYGAYSTANQRETEREITNEETSDPQGQELEDLLDLQLYPIYLLLVGYAVEVFIKGIIFSKNPSLLISGEVLSKNHTTHSLLDLYQKSGLSIDDDIEDILNGLEEFVKWKGRYAIPKNIETYMKQREFPKILHDHAKIEKLVGYLLFELDTIPSVAFTNAKLEFTKR